MTDISQKLVFKQGLTFKNRIVMAPMTTMMSFSDGVVTRDELAYYGLRSGEVGAVITAAANVHPSGKGWEGELGVYDDRFIPGLSQLSATIKKNGTKAILQIFHGGRMTDSKVLRGERPVSASEIPAERPDAEVPKALTEFEIKELIEAFKRGTERAIKAGFDGVEIHGANTYLLQQFFSPHSNRREDRWGGSLAKRYGFIEAVVDGVTEIVADSDNRQFIVGYRFSPEEYETPGIRFEDTLYLIDHLATKPLDYLHISLNDYRRVSVSQDYQAESILHYVHERLRGRLPLIGVGDVRTGADGKAVLIDGEAVAVGRALLIDPHWASKVLAGKEEVVRRTLSQFDREELIIENGLWGTLQKMMPDRLG